MSVWTCKKCDHPLRAHQATIAAMPGTRQHRANGLCKTCYYQERAAGTIPAPSSGRGRKPADPDQMFEYRFDERQASAALEAWLRERRNRLAKQGVLA